MCPTDYGSLSIDVGLYNLGASSNDVTVRYPDDVYDRMWQPKNFSNWVPLRIAPPINIQGDSDPYNLPKKVLQSAVQPLNASSMYYWWRSYNITKKYLVYLHFAELVQHENGQLREMNITINRAFTKNATLEYLKPVTIFSPSPISGNVLNFTISAPGNSSLSPILNAFGLFEVMQLNSTPTALNDVVAMKDVKEKYKLTRNWQGDPCLPGDYRWNGLDCRYDDPPRIISLNLSSLGLTGDIAASISKLTALKYLLTDNKLSGQLPEFLAQMPSLEVLNLSANKITGSVPEPLEEKSNDGKLVLSLAGNPVLRPAGKSIRNVVVVVASAVSFLLVIVISALFIFWKNKRKSRLKIQRPEITTKLSTQGLLLSKDRQFSYSELLRITDRFSTIIGRGGFGNVYYGNLDGGTGVAVKLLSQSSKQGYKEFHAEAQLLLMVHHRNLVSLLGYCIDGETMALIYEYMANGNVQRHLSDSNANILQWDQRLQVAIDAAQGLEYLHNGCRPPIVHRDLKLSKILLDDKMQAKIGDFGLSRVFGSETATHVSTGPAGTLGYLAPEVQSSGNFNKKTDVYSFGIVLLELITGQPALLKRPTGNIHILDWVTPVIERGDIRNIVDSRLQGKFDYNSAWKAVDIAMSCVPLTTVERPDIAQILIELKECLAIHLMTPEGTQSINLDSEVPQAR